MICERAIGAEGESFAIIANDFPGGGSSLSKPQIGKGDAVADSPISLCGIEILIAGHDSSIGENTRITKGLHADKIVAFYPLALAIAVSTVLLKIRQEIFVG